MGEVESTQAATESSSKHMTEEYKQLVKENAALEKKLKIKTAEVTKKQKQAERERATIEAQTAKLTARMDALKAKAEAQEEASKSNDDQIKADRAENERAQRELDDLIKQKSETLKRAASIEQERVRYKKEHARLMAMLPRQEKALKDQLKATERAEIAANREKASLEKEDIRLQAMQEKLKAALEAKKDSMKGFQEKLVLVQNSLKDHRVKQGELVKKMEAIAIEMKKIEGQKQMALTEIQKIKHQMPATQSKLHLTESRYREMLETYKTISGEAAQLKKQNQGMEAQVVKAENSVHSLAGLIEAGKEEIKNAHKEHDDLIRRGNKAEIDRNRYAAQLDLLKHEYERILAQNRALKAGRNSASQ